MTGALDLTVGIVGAGSMGGAIARGLVASGTLEAARVLVADFDAEKRAALSALGMRAFDGAEALLAEGPDVVVLAVKPQVLPGVMEQAAPHVRGRLAISIAAGVPLSALEDAMPGARVVRVMPNLPVQVRSGATALTAGSLATPEDVELARELFSALGSVAVMREDQLDVAGAVVGTAPAFFSLLVDELTRAAVLRGQPAADPGGVGVQILPQRRVGGERITAVPKRLHRRASEAVFAIVCRRAVSYSCRNWEIVGLAKIVTKCNH